MTRKQRRRIIIAAVCAIFLIITFGRGAMTNYQLNQKLKRLEGEIAALELRNEQIRADIKQYQSPEYIERIAREQLGLVKPREIKYIISQPAQSSSSGSFD